MPSPPTCISIKMTHWPNKVNTFPVSTTPSPVTVQAETVVNKASSHEIDVVVAIGNFNKHVPIIDNIIKDKVRTRGGTHVNVNPFHVTYRSFQFAFTSM